MVNCEHVVHLSIVLLIKFKQVIASWDVAIGYPGIILKPEIRASFSILPFMIYFLNVCCPLKCHTYLHMESAVCFLS